MLMENLWESDFPMESWIEKVALSYLMLFSIFMANKTHNFQFIPHIFGESSPLVNKNRKIFYS